MTALLFLLGCSGDEPQDTKDTDPPGEDTETAPTVIDDADGDGFTAEDGDCDDSDPNVRPGGMDLSLDGIDQNCDGRDGSGGSGGVHCPAATATSPGPSKRESGLTYPYWSGCIDAPGGTFQEAQLGMSFWGNVDGDFVCTSYGTFRDVTPATDCPGCTFAFKGDVLGAYYTGPFCVGMAVDELDWDYPDFGLGYAPSYDDGTQVWGQAAMLYYGGGWEPIAYTTLDGVSSLAYVNADADGMDFKAPYMRYPPYWAYFLYYRY